MARLTEPQIKEAIEGYRSGLSLVATGTLVGVSGTAISSLMKRMGIERRTLSESKRTLACNHEYFNEPLDEERAYWLGFILADGSVSDRGYSVTERLSVVLKESDSGHLEKLKNALGSGHKILPVKHPEGRCCSRFAISSSEIVGSLRRFNIVPRKSADQVYSDLIPAHLLKHYFRGYFDGNGGISRHGRSKWIINAVSSERFLEAFVDWTVQQVGGHRPSITFSCGIHRVSWAGTHRCKEILDLLYVDATVFLDRKIALYREICSDADSSSRGPYNRR